jgi:hypothetical protein
MQSPTRGAGIATNSDLEGWHSIPGKGKICFCPLPARDLGPPVSYRRGKRAISLGETRPGCETGHSPLSSAEIRSGGIVEHAPNVFLARCFLHQAQGQLCLLGLLCKSKNWGGGGACSSEMSVSFYRALQRYVPEEVAAREPLWPP